MTFVGFWEQAVFQSDGLKISGWALNQVTGLPPSSFAFIWDEQVDHFRPSVERSDVSAMLDGRGDQCGFNAVLRVRLSPNRDWGDPRIVALWPDGSTYVLRPLRPVVDGHLRSLSFDNFDDYARHFQNPAFRIQNSVVQAYGARRALLRAEPGSIFWQAAAVVALYRHFLDDLVSQQYARELISTWRDLRPVVEMSARGEAMRWAISMDLACGYAHLAWREHDEARVFFAAIPPFAERINTWPQAVTNIGIGMFVAAWLEYRRQRPDLAKEMLRGSDTLFQSGTKVLHIWSWHHFEELKNALRIHQYCFGFQKLLDDNVEEHIVPLTVTLSLREISLVLADLVARGLEDGPFPSSRARIK